MNLSLLSLLMPMVGGVPVEPVIPAAPVLYVKLIAPEGTRTAVHPGSPLEQLFDTPLTLALRPGYRYHFRLEHVPGMDGAALFPSVEVRGSLHPPAGMDIADYPVPIVLTTDDLNQIRTGAMVTKVLYLEDPEEALGQASETDRPIELDSATELSAVNEARLRGRVMLLFRIGEKDYSPDEIGPWAVPGTVLLPGEPILAPPAAPPHFAPVVWSMIDPIAGPKPTTEECLHDGGDLHPFLGVGPTGDVGGLNPSETSLEYTLGGQRRVTTSNRVCICVPRFIALRVLTRPERVHLPVGVLAEQRLEGPERIDTQQPPLRVEQVEGPRVTQMRVRPAETESIQAVHALELAQAPVGIAQYAGLAIAAEFIGPDQISVYPGCRFPLQKWVEPPGPHHIGQEVTFYLRYTNAGSEPMQEVAVSDNLTARLEYVRGSAKSDREASFTITPNEAGSMILRWSFSAPLAPGQSGVVAFRARIR